MRFSILSKLAAVVAVVSFMLGSQVQAEKLVYKWTMRGTDIYSDSGSTKGTNLRKLSYGGYVVVNYDDSSATFGTPVMARTYKDTSTKTSCYCEEWFLSGKGEFVLTSADKGAHWMITRDDEQYIGKIPNNGIKFEDKTFLVPSGFSGESAWNKTFASGRASMGYGIVKMTYSRKLSELVALADKTSAAFDAGKSSVDDTVDEITSAYRRNPTAAPDVLSKYSSILALGKFKKIETDEELTDSGSVDWSNVAITGGTVDNVNIGFSKSCAGLFSTLGVGVPEKYYMLPVSVGTTGQAMVVGSDGNMTFGSAGVDEATMLAAVDTRINNMSVELAQTLAAKLLQDAVTQKTFLGLLAQAILDHPDWFDINKSLDIDEIIKLIADADKTVLKEYLIANLDMDALMARMTTAEITSYILGKMDTETLLAKIFAADEDLFNQYIAYKISPTTIITNMTSSDCDSMRANLGLLKCNMTAKAAPTAADDSSKGYSKGSTWLNLSSGKYYVCTSNTVSAAAWTELGLSDSDRVKLGYITVTAATNLDSMRSDWSSMKTKTDLITVSTSSNLDSMRSDIFSAKTKTDFLTVTAATNLNTMRTDLATVKTDATASKTKTDFLTVTAATDLDGIRTKVGLITCTTAFNLDNLSGTLAYTAGEQAKVGYLTVTANVNLDTLKASCATNDIKRTYPSDDETKVGYLKATQKINLDKMYEAFVWMVNNDVGGIRTTGGFKTTDFTW